MMRDLRQWWLHSFLGAPCADNKVDPYIRKLTRETINWKQTTGFPSGGWSKGSTTLSLLRWFLAARRQRSDTIPEDSLLRLCFKAALNINLFFSKPYRHQVWIKREAALEIAKHGFQFLHYNAELAEGCFRENLALFMHMPNLHRLHHIFFELHDGASRSDYAMSPLVIACQMEEDFIGRPSRLSRRQRTIRRALEASYAEYVRAGLIIPSN